ncbi:UNVERIFIED_ORG: hypothetical protein ABIC43_000505 [Variovorax guangxiensis]
MPKRAIQPTPAFRQAVDDMQAKAGPNTVGLVMRFNEDDSTLRDLWSEGSNAPKHKYNPHPADRPDMWRNDLPNGGQRLANKVNDQRGYHAEEIFIACWPALLRGADLAEAQLRCVELVISKSPCHGRSGSSELRLGANPVYLPMGCSSKLSEFVQSKDRRIEWRVAFLSLNGSDATSYDPIGGPGFDRLMSAREREIADAADRQVRFQSVAAPRMRSHALHLNNRAAVFEMVAPGLNGPARGTLMTMAREERQAARDLLARVNQRSIALATQARTSSVGVAQQGIAVLERLPNVDVRRWI